MVPARLREYAHLMINKKTSGINKQAGFVLGAVLLAALAQGAGSAAGQSVQINVPAPVVVAPVVVIQDDYVYYPSYAIYYNSGRHQYAYLEGDLWVWAPAPRNVTVEVLLASPSVHMDFHDALARHHAEMLQKYPRNWQPAGGKLEQKLDQRLDQRSERKAGQKVEQKADQKLDKKIERKEARPDKGKE